MLHFAFPWFKTRKTYQLYKKQAIKDWENMIFKTGCVMLLFEIARLIEDFHHGKYTDWSVLWITKAIYGGFYLLTTFGRWLLIKLFKGCKRAFLDISEILILVMYIMLTVYTLKIPTGPSDPNPLWAIKENLRTFVYVITLCFSFYNWILPPLILATIIIQGAVYYTKLLPGFEWLYMPTYVMLVVGMLGFCFFIEKLRRNNFEAHTEANMKEKVWKEILNELPEGTLIINQKKDIVYVNHAFYSILNMNNDKTFEQLNDLSTITDLSIQSYNSGTNPCNHDFPRINKFQDLQEMIWKEWDSLAKYFASPLPHDEYKMFKGQFLVDEGRSKSFEIKFTIRNFGGQNVALFIFSDVSERLYVDYLKQTVEYKNKLLASVSHELRTPLNGNINFIQEVIQNPAVPKEAKETRLIPALRSAQYLLILINDMLDFSQMQNQNLRLVPTVKSIVQTVKEAMELVEIQAQKKRLYLTLEPILKGYQYDIKTDHNRVLQIVANLLSNALKFTFSGGITVTIKPENYGIYRITVEDTGIGIKLEDQPKLFKAFGKLDLGSENHMNAQGVGLGLVISNSLAVMLGPKEDILKPKAIMLDKEEKPLGITFESEYGKGTKFSFRIVDQNERRSRSNTIIASEGSQINEIPEFLITNAEPEFIVTSADIPLLKSRNCQCPEIIVADDDAFNILTLETILKTLGHRSESAYNGQQVIECIMKRISNPCSMHCKPHKMIFLDCNMPIMDGYDCAASLNKIFDENPDYRCPIVACTAASHQAEKDKALGAGMTHFMSKPVNKAHIQTLIDSCCREESSESDSP